MWLYGNPLRFPSFDYKCCSAIAQPNGVVALPPQLLLRKKTTLAELSRFAIVVSDLSRTFAQQLYPQYSERRDPNDQRPSSKRLSRSFRSGPVVQPGQRKNASPDRR